VIGDFLHWGSGSSIGVAPNKEGVFNAVPHSKPPGHRVGGQSVNLSPLRQRLCLATYCNQIIIPSIPTLLLFSSPPYISWLVTSIIVNSIKRMFRGRLPTYVVKERLKVFNPRAVHLNTSAAIPTIPRIFWVVTSCFYTSPSVVLCGPVHPVFYPHITY